MPTSSSWSTATSSLEYLVDETGRVKLLDYGIAKLLDADGDHTDVGARPQTPHYASPEQLEGDGSRRPLTFIS